METRANYILIGAFTIAGFLGLLAFFAWFANTELDRQFDYYDVYFDNVSGLDRASDVRFAGLSVGQVVDLALSEQGDGRVRVRLEVSSATPVRADSTATIEAQGVTGVAFVGITAGSPEAALLSVSGARVPEIPAGRSVLQSLSEDAPALLEEALNVIERISALLNEENRQRVETILANLETSSGQLNETLTQFSAVATDVGSSVSEIASFTGELQGISDAVTGTLDLAESAIVTITDLSDNAQATLDAGTETLTSARGAIDVTGNFIDQELRAAVTDLTATSAALRQQTESLGPRAEAFLSAWQATGETANARLAESEALIAGASASIDDLTATLASLQNASDRLSAFVETDAQALVDETRAAVGKATTAIDAVTRTVNEDLPVVVTDIRTATETATNTFTRLSEDLTGASGKAEALINEASVTLASVTATFERANQTLGSIESTLEIGDKTLASAERAFTGAERFLDEDIGTITEDLRAAIGSLEATIAAVSEDLPEITADLRSAAGAAESAFGDIATLAANAEVPVGDFLRGGLPQYTRLAAETRELIALLDRLVTQIERDPARFFLSPAAPEYRR